MTNLEHLSSAEHDKWASWMNYLFEVSVENEDGSVTIPKDKVERWKRQCATHYLDLSEREKQSDRDVVIEYFGVLDFVDI